MWVVGPWPLSATITQAWVWVALLLASLGAERARGPCPAYAHSPSRRLGTCLQVPCACPPHAVPRTLSMSTCLCQRFRKCRRPPGLINGMQLFYLTGIDLLFQAYRTLTAHVGLFLQLSTLKFTSSYVVLGCSPVSRAGGLPCCRPAAGSAQMQHTPDLACAEPGSPPVPTRGLWSGPS